MAEAGNVIATPFDELLVELTTETFSQVSKAPDSEQRKRSFVSHQLQLLRSAYSQLVRVSNEQWESLETRKQQPREGTISLRAMVLDQRGSAEVVFLSYFSYISILRQFDRVLPRHCQVVKPFPGSIKIDFYRNKVLEHWDDYTDLLGEGGSGFNFVKGKPAIPSIMGVLDNEERKSAIEQIYQYFADHNIQFAWPIDQWYSNVDTVEGYTGVMYEALERTKKMKLRADEDPLFAEFIKNLFRVGFPNPITNLEAYSVELVSYIREVVRQAKLLSALVSTLPLTTQPPR